MVRRRVVVVGSINRDVVAEVDRMPVPGETVLARRVRHNLGGKGSNQAVAAARAGAPVSLIARLGERDAAPDRLREALRAAGVDVTGIGTAAGVETGTAFVTTAAGRNQIVVDPAANLVWAEPPPADLIRGTVAVCQAEIPMWVNEAVGAAGPARLVVNAAPATPIPESLLLHCDPLVVNEHELGVVADTDVAGQISPAETATIAQRLIDRGLPGVVVTLGAAGAIYGTATGLFRQAAPDVPVVDSTGAGDAFVGSLAARLAAGASSADAVRWAVAAASLSVGHPGTHAAYPTAAEVDRFLDRAPAAVPL
ncbi:ribokinase [Skermania piniformis]|uniref:Ribokinase n=1 Tax=Skermania pinensis TaxID=39122 RepID=A0ABX8S952_9ACTN|nr:ribokinase [Skermania piniformis]QXQ14393.1 ribokinase [Skermania piniformis]